MGWKSMCRPSPGEGIGQLHQNGLGFRKQVQVTLHADGFTSEGQVRYCQLGDYSFLIGLQFDSETSPRRFGWRPDHLLER